MNIRTFSAALALILFTAAAGAETLYRVDLRGNVRYLAAGAPAVGPDAIVFRRHPDGTLIRVPRAEVMRVAPVSSASVSAPITAPLRPGQMIVLGPTGGYGGPQAEEGTSTIPAYAGPPASGAQAGLDAIASLEAQIFVGDARFPPVGTGGMGGGYGGNPGPFLPAPANAASLPTGSFSSLPLAPAGVGTGQQLVNPNGFLNITPQGPGAGNQSVGPNGFLQIPGSGPQAGSTPVGSNGFFSPAPSPGGGPGR